MRIRGSGSGILLSDNLTNKYFFRNLFGIFQSALLVIRIRIIWPDPGPIQETFRIREKKKYLPITKIKIMI